MKLRGAGRSKAVRSEAEEGGSELQVSFDERRSDVIPEEDKGGEESSASGGAGTYFIHYGSRDVTLLLERRLGHYSRCLLDAIRRGESIADLLKRLGFFLDFYTARMLAEEAIRAKNIAALTDLAEVNPFAVAKVLEENISALSGVNDLRLFHLYFLVRDKMTIIKERLFRKLVSHIVVKKALGLTSRRVTRSGGVRRRVGYLPNRDFDLEATIERGLERLIAEGIVAKDDIVSIEKREKRSAGAIIIDFSGSMYGSKNLLASLVSALVTFTLAKTDEFSIIVFSDEATVLKSIREPADVRKLLNEIFEIKPLGYTNIADALRTAAEELKKASVKTRRWAILITDGEYNRGDDPTKYGRLFSRLHVIQLGGGALGTYVCKTLARGRGKYLKVSSVDELLQAVRRLLRYPDR